MGTYAEYLECRAQADSMAGFEPLWLPDFLFGFQRSMTDWAVRQGRAGLFEDCGLGKSVQELVWAQNVHKHTGKPVLLLTPLAVTFQMEAEAAKFGIEAATSRHGKVTAPVTVTNYERLHHFDRDDYGGVVCDESSAIKAFDGARRAIVTDFCRKMPYRLLATATAAPNDYTELGTSSEALGYLGLTDMLGRFFVNDKKTIDTRGSLRAGSARTRSYPSCPRGGSRVTPKSSSGGGWHRGPGRCASRPTTGSPTTGSACRPWSTGSTSSTRAPRPTTGPCSTCPRPGCGRNATSSAGP